MSVESIKELMDGFDPAALLPELDTIIGRVEFFTRLAVMIGPLVLLVLGVLYFFAAPREANYHFGYRCFFGMGSVQAWRLTQRIAGIVFAALGLMLTVIMLIVCAGFRGMELPDMVGSGITALIWEVILAVLAVLGINVTMGILFDRKGERRQKASGKKTDGDASAN